MSQADADLRSARRSLCRLGVQGLAVFIEHVDEQVPFDGTPITVTLSSAAGVP
jgi:hypothetical protein